MIGRRALGSCWLALAAGCGVARSSPDAVSDVEASAPAPLTCVEADCAALGGACKRAGCDEETGLCRVRSAEEGEACLEGNACGAAVCRHGACVALAAPACAPPSDACHTQVCQPEANGCVSESSASAAGGCAAPIELGRTAIRAQSAQLDCAPSAHDLPGCFQGLSGPSLVFALDLSQEPGPRSVELLIDSSASFEAALTRGPCEDPVLVACSEPFYSDGRSRHLELVLDPGRYWLWVAGARTGETGTVRVIARVGDVTCSAAPHNDLCAAPLPLDTSLEQQSVIASAACAGSELLSRCAQPGSPDIFYQLDLSRRSSDVMLDLESDDVSALFLFDPIAGEPCGAAWQCGQRFSRRLAPGVYTLGASRIYDRDTPIRFRVRLSAVDCAASNDTWQGAVELDPRAPLQSIRANSACATDQLHAACNVEDRGAPDLFYRLDLSQQSGLTTLSLDGTAPTDAIVYLLEGPLLATPALPQAVTLNPSVSDAASLPPDVTRAAGCHDVDGSSFSLPPRLYYLVLDGRGQSQGRFELELRLAPGLHGPVPCIARSGATREVEACAYDIEPACWISFAEPECLRAYVECGLAPQVYADFCGQFPSCCQSGFDESQCSVRWRQATSCVVADPAESSPDGG